MKIFGDYLRRHLGGIGILLACCGIFVLVFSLYDLPAEAVLYGGVLSAVLYLFWFLVRFRKYYQKCRTLRQMQQEIVITTRPPPAAGGRVRTGVSGTGGTAVPEAAGTDTGMAGAVQRHD